MQPKRCAQTVYWAHACVNSQACRLGLLHVSAAQAEARQQKFDTSAVGKAAKKAVDAARKEKEAPPQGADRARDWLS